MKKLWMIAVVACAALMVSCASVEEKAKDYVKEHNELLQKGDSAGLKELQEEIDEYVKGLSKEDQKKFAAAFAAAL